MFAPGWSPPARPAPKPHITHAPPRSALVAQRAGVSLPAARKALDCTLQAPGGLFCGWRRLPQAAQPRIALGVPAADSTRSRAAAPFCHQAGGASWPQPTGVPPKAASGGARRLTARAKVRVSVGGAEGRALTRCAAESFFNREDEVAEFKSLLLDEPSGVTLLLGPRDCGKSALLLQVEEELQAAAQGGRPRGLVPRLAALSLPPPLLHIDCRGISVSTPAALSEALRKAAIEAKVGPRVSGLLAAAAGFGASVGSIGGAPGPLAWPSWVLRCVLLVQSLAGFKPSLTALLESFTAYFAACKAAGVTPVLVIDEANELMAWREEDQAALRALLSFFILVTKQQKRAHVVLATSDPFFTSWLSNRGFTLVDVKVLGDLPEDDAKRYFCGDGSWAGLVARRHAPPLEAGTWAEVYAVCGGNAALLNQCAGMAKQAGSSWGKALDKIQATGSANVTAGFDARALPLRAHPPAWSVQQYKAALRCIAQAPHHAVRRSALVEALNLDGSQQGDEAAKAALLSLVQYNLLALRPFSPQPWSTDLPEEVYGPSKKREAVVTMPGPAHLRHVLLLEEEWAEGEAAAAAAAGGGGGAASG